MIIKTRLFSRIPFTAILSAVMLCIFSALTLFASVRSGIPVNALQEDATSALEAPAEAKNANDIAGAEKSESYAPAEVEKNDGIITNEDDITKNEDENTQNATNGDNTPEKSDDINKDQITDSTDGKNEQEGNAPEETGSAKDDDTEEPANDVIEEEPKAEENSGNNTEDDKKSDAETDEPEIDDTPEGPDKNTESDPLLRFISIVMGEVGTKEKAYNNVKYNTWYYGKTVRDTRASSAKYAWCICFISWCANKAGIDTSIIQKTASAGTLRNFYINKGLYESRSAHTPKVGDIIFFGRSGVSHGGVVVAVNGNTIQTVEGNCTDMVKVMTYNINDSYILGYASPDYYAAAK